MGRRTHDEQRALGILTEKCFTYLVENFHKFEETKRMHIALEIVKKRMPTNVNHSGEIAHTQVNIIMPTDKKLNGHTSDTQAERCLPALNE